MPDGYDWEAHWVALGCTCPRFDKQQWVDGCRAGFKGQRDRTDPGCPVHGNDGSDPDPRPPTTRVAPVRAQLAARRDEEQL